VDFKAPALKELTDQQVRYAPAARRREQVARAGRLLGELDPGKVYPYQFVCYRITDFRSAAHADLLIPGGDLKPDLAEFIRRVERSIPPLPIEQAVEPILTLDEVSKRLNVSTKTVGRWRVRGLVGQRVIVRGRRQLGFPKSLLDRFLEENSSLVARGSSFSPLADDERETILYRARRLALAGGDITTVSKDIRVFGDMAVSTGQIDMVDLAHGEPRTLRLFQTLVWQKEGGKWTLLHRHATRVAEPAAPASPRS